jgi:hypothetical protein
MIKTLRITTIVAAVLAAILLVFPVVFGVRSSEHIEKLLKSPGVIEKFNKTVSNKATRSGNETSPLVQQAGAFALYLDPLTSKAPKTAARSNTRDAKSGPDIDPKLPIVIGTSYYKRHPELSLALIDVPGKGLHWVRQSGEIGRLFVEQIKDGLIVVKYNGITHEIAAEQKPEASLLEGSSAVPKRTGVPSREPNKADTKSTVPAFTRARTGKTRARSRTPRPNRSTEEDAELNELIEELRNIHFKSDKISSGLSVEEKEAMMDKLISEFKTSRLSAEEAKNLGDLGRDLVLEKEGSNQSLPVKKGGK